MPAVPPPDDEAFDPIAARDHIDEILPSLQGLPPEEAERRLVEGLRARGLRPTGRFFLALDDLDPELQADERALLDALERGEEPAAALARWQREQNARIEAHNARVEALLHAENVARFGQDVADAMWAEEHDPEREHVGQAIEDAVDAWADRDPDHRSAGYTMAFARGDGDAHRVWLPEWNEELRAAIERAVHECGSWVEVRRWSDADNPVPD